MVTQYVMGLNQFLTEAVSPEETAFKSIQQKYEADKIKDTETYKQYTEGTITKDQYMQSFEKLLQTEMAYRRAQIAYKLAAPRGTAQPVKPGQQQNKPGEQIGNNSAAPGNLPG